MLKARACLAAGAGFAALSLSAASVGQVGVLCAIEGPGNCQLPDQLGHGSGGTIAATSDANPNFGFTVADNFSPMATGQITAVCWWGVYTDFSVNCGGSPPADAFTITFFTSTPAVPGPIPSGVVVGGPFAVTATRQATGNVVPSGIGDLTEFEYTATLPSPVSVQVNRCFWIEIRNNTTGACAWLWSTAPPGDDNSAQHDDGSYDAPPDVNDFDLAWCVNLAVTALDACIPDVCGDPLSGPCDAVHATPGCDDEACCAAVCGDDPFCCNQEWDDNCVATAYGPKGLCAVAACGSPGTGGCFGTHATPFCDDTCGADACPGCCDIVCAVDPFCCDTSWDAFCVDEAEELCVGCKSGPPPNNNCVDAIPLGVGTFPVTNVCASPGPPNHASCNDTFAVGLGLDVWFVHTATFTGNLFILPEAEAGSGWITQCAVYLDDNCGALEDPPLGCAPLGSGVVVPVTFNSSYLIRLGGTYNGRTGSGTLSIFPVFPACGGPGDCLAPHANAGCSDLNCCAVVCAADPTCCSDPWDEACVDLAADICDPLPCGPLAGGATVIEPEPCGADTDGGCNTDPPPPAFVTIGDDDVISGTAWADAGTRDTDWYLLPVAELTAADADADGAVDVHYVVQSELPVVSFMIEDGASDCSGDEAVLGSTGYGQSCINVAPGVATVAINPANRYVVFAGTGNGDGSAVFEGFPCSGPAFGNDYLLCVAVTDDGAAAPTTPCSAAPECPWDCQVAPDGNVGINDLLVLLATWNADGACNFDGGLVGITDLLKLLANWGPCR